MNERPYKPTDPTASSIGLQEACKALQLHHLSTVGGGTAITVFKGDKGGLDIYVVTGEAREQFEAFAATIARELGGGPDEKPC